jgi:hypothetical protein
MTVILATAPLLIGIGEFQTFIGITAAQALCHVYPRTGPIARSITSVAIPIEPIIPLIATQTRFIGTSGCLLSIALFAFGVALLIRSYGGFVAHDTKPIRTHSFPNNTLGLAAVG